MIARMTKRSLAVLIPFALACWTAHGSNLFISGTVPWTDTGIFVQAGDELVISATGSVSWGGASTDPNGVGTFRDGTQTLPSVVVPTAIIDSLIGKIGGTTAIGDGNPVPQGAPGKGAGFVGSSYDEIISQSGELFLGYNDDLFGDNSGGYNVSISVVPEPSLAALAAAGSLILFLHHLRMRYAPATC